MRVANRVIAGVLGLAVIAVGGLLIAEGVAVLLGRELLVLTGETLSTPVSGLSWSDVALRWIALGVALVGIGLVFAELAPRRRKTWAMPASESGRLTTALDRRGLTALAAETAERDREVAEAKAKVRGGHIRVFGDVPPGTDRSAASDRVGRAVTEELSTVLAGKPPRVKTRLREREGRTR